MSAYPIESSGFERTRLARQAQIAQPFTERVLRNAGAGEGCGVLDLGTGAGDVALLAGEIVGAKGRVTSMDRDPANLEHARRRAAEGGVKQLTFVEGDIAAPPTDAPFDLAVGRYVLMYQADPVATVRGIARAVRPGGAIVFHELNMFEGMRGDTWPPMPDAIRDDLGRLQRSMIGKVRQHMGAELPHIFADAGLDISGWHFEGAAPLMNRDDGVAQMLGLWRMWAGVSIAAGSLKENDIDFDGYQNWLMRLPEDAAILQPSAILGWARKPA